MKKEVTTKIGYAIAVVHDKVVVSHLPKKLKKDIAHLLLVYERWR